LGGGQGSYEGFKIPVKMRINENGTYEAEVVDSASIKFLAASAVNRLDSVIVFIDSEGRLHSWRYTGDFE
jgi:hypothetical protein